MFQPNLDEIRFALAEKSLADFTRIGWRYIDPADYIGNWHIDAMSEHLEAVANGQILRLIINIPPRHMKSLMVSVSFPAWVWAQQRRSPLTGPGVGFLSTSYAQHLSVRDNVKCRRLIDSPWYQKGWGDRFQLTSDQNTKIRFENDQGGYRIASSVDGTATGDGGHIVTIDDPISAKESQSQTIRAAANDWFDNTMSTRLNDPKTGAYIIIMQRLHEDDLVGHVMERSGEDWTILCLPARYEADHPFVWTKPAPGGIIKGDPRKKSGVGLLWPKRMGEPEVRKLEIQLGSYGAAGQLQQRPAPREGGMLKRAWFEVVDAAPAQMECVRAWDLAATVETPGQDPDWTAGVKIGRCSEGYAWILDVKRFREGPANVEKAIKNTGSQDGKAVRIRIPQDPGQAGKAQAKNLVRMLAGFAVKAVPPTGAKEVRATPLAAQAEAGNVKVVKGAWNEAFFDELDVFPFGKHDDQIDAAADAFNELFDAEGSSGFFAMISEDNTKRRIADLVKAEAAAATDPSECPYPKGSLEYLQFHGLVPKS